MAGLIEETLRYEAPIQLVFRKATQEVELGGVAIEVAREQVRGARDRRCRARQQPHFRLDGRAAALAVVAGVAGRDEVLPIVRAPTMLRHDVVEGERAASTSTVLTALVVARKYLAAGQARTRERPLDVVVEADHGGCLEIALFGGVDRLRATFEHLGLAVEDQHERTSHGADVQRFVILVQHQRAALDGDHTHTPGQDRECS